MQNRFLFVKRKIPQALSDVRQ